LPIAGANLVKTLARTRNALKNLEKSLGQASKGQTFSSFNCINSGMPVLDFVEYEVAITDSLQIVPNEF